MNKRITAICLTVALNVLAATPALATRNEASVQASYEQAVCRKAQTAEVTYWMSRQDWRDTPSLVALHKNSLRTMDAFAADAVGIEIVFKRGPDGKIVSFDLYQGGRITPAKKIQ